MDILYNIGRIDIFRNLKILLFVISILMIIIAIIKLRKIILNYNYINRDISMLENLKKLSDKEFISWINDYLNNKGYYDLKHLEEGFYTINDCVRKKLVFIERKYNILDKVEAKYVLGYSLINDFDKVIIVTTGKCDESFYELLEDYNLIDEVFSKNDFNKGYKNFVVDEF